MTAPTPAIVWFRRDLRLTDHPALAAAAASGQPLIPLYIRSDWNGSHRWTGPIRQQFLCQSLASLDANLRSLGSRLVIRHGSRAANVLMKLARETGAGSLFFHRDPDPHGRSIEQTLAEECRNAGIECHALHDHWLVEPGTLLTGQGTPYRVFTPWYRAWEKLDKPQPRKRPRNLPPCPKNIPSDPLPSLSDWNLSAPPDHPGILPGGEANARKRLSSALSGPIRRYAADRDTPHGQTTSRLSQDLRFGLLSPREVHARARQLADEAEDPAVRRSALVFLSELGWREFYFHILHHFPEVLDHEFNSDYRSLPWENDRENLSRWQEGQTGFPIVDAAMRQLAATGFMHNRLRMITAMFLTKDLRIDWRHGERHFMQSLMDGEIAANNGGWQWSAGTGADAAPYFRIQNPWTQSKRHDPEARFIREWLPELRDMPAEALHEPPATGALHKSYPPPMVDHAREREKTLEWFKRHRAAAKK